MKLKELVKDCNNKKFSSLSYQIEIYNKNVSVAHNQ